MQFKEYLPGLALTLSAVACVLSMYAVFAVYKAGGGRLPLIYNGSDTCYKGAITARKDVVKITSAAKTVSCE